MIGHHESSELAELTAPARNNYFYGKMLGVYHFQMEQAYFNRKRWLLNRLGLGSGVLCGLEVVPAEDGKCLWLKPGVAIDGYGREIVIPGPFCIEDPRQPTDDCGRPSGPPIAGEGAVTIWVCYHECEGDPTPVLVGDCDTRNDCAPGTIRERFSIRITAGAALPAGGLTEAQCAAIFPEDPPDGFDRRAAACDALTAACPPPTPDCVAVATIRLPASATDPVVVEQCAPRTTVYSNARLFDMLVCLAGRMDACCDHNLLRYVSGDAQQAAPGVALPAPVVVEVVDSRGVPVAAEPVTFTVRGGGGTVSASPVPTGADGRAQVNWTLGPAAGLNTLAASIAGQPELPLFALGVAAPATLPPVILATWPDPAEVIRTDSPIPSANLWIAAPVVAITFDRKMDQQLIEDHRRWLRVHRLVDGDRTTVTPVDMGLSEVVEEFQGRRGFTAIYKLGINEPRQPAKYLVQVRTTSGEITDTGTPPLTLDPDFAGTRLTQANRDRIFDLTAETALPRTVFTTCTSTGASLPKSGDGAEGGQFHSFFEVARLG